MIKKIRKLNKLTQKDLADRIGVTQSFISKLEKRDCASSYPNLKTYKLIASELNICPFIFGLWLINCHLDNSIPLSWFSSIQVRCDICVRSGACDIDVKVWDEYKHYIF